MSKKKSASMMTHEELVEAGMVPSYTIDDLAEAAVTDEYDLQDLIDLVDEPNIADDEEFEVFEANDGVIDTLGVELDFVRRHARWVMITWNVPGEGSKSVERMPEEIRDAIFFDEYFYETGDGYGYPNLTTGDIEDIKTFLADLGGEWLFDGSCYTLTV